MKALDKHLLCKNKSCPVLNASNTFATKKSGLKSHGTVWFHPGCIENIVSLNNVQKRYYSTLNQGFVVHKADVT